MFAYFLGKTGDREQALDLLQELFLGVWRSLEAVWALPAHKRQFWVFSIARNLVVDQFRARAARARAQAVIEPSKQWSDAPESAHVEREQLAMIDAAIGRLPQDLRIVFVLQAVGERNSTEIGELLGRPPGTVRYQLSEARKRLAADLRLREVVEA